MILIYNASYDHIWGVSNELSVLLDTSPPVQLVSCAAVGAAKDIKVEKTKDMPRQKVCLYVNKRL